MEEEKKYVTGLPRSKSLNFLYPLTGFKKDGVNKIGTYLYWKDEGIDNLKLIIKYKDVNKNFNIFEKEVLLKNDRIESCYKVTNGMVYIYDMGNWAEDIYQFLEGRYSKMTEKAKKVILDYHNIEDIETVKPGRYVYMTLYPEKFFRPCAEELGVSEDVLRSNGELLGKFSLELETLDVDIDLDCNCVEPKILTL